MTDILRYTLLADGSSDEVLTPVLDWLIAQHLPQVGVVSAFAKDFGKVGHDLSARVAFALKNFPCDLLFVHRDAEAESREHRVLQIAAAMEGRGIPFVSVVPVRMTEAWLLADEDAIRFASGNATSRVDLHLPERRRWETLADPKDVLQKALCTASEKKGRALQKFKPLQARHLITKHSTDFSALRGLSAFDAVEADLISSLKEMNYALD